MKNRNMIFGVIMAVLAGVVLLPQMGAATGERPKAKSSTKKPLPLLAENFAGSNTFDGFRALFFITTGTFNSAYGWFSQFFVTDGSFNTAAGAGSLDTNNGSFNSAFGAGALLLNRSASNNTAVGTEALVFNDETNNNTAVLDTAVGSFALAQNTDGDSNTAVGAFALNSNTTAAGVSGISNNAIGRDALFSNTTGSFNEAMGVNALAANGTGSNNVAIGDDALSGYTGAAGINGNTAVGQSAALFTDPNDGPNTAVGAGALTGAMAQISTSGFNVAVGDQALTNYTGVLVTDGANTAVGSIALFAETGGQENVAVGRRALEGLLTGQQNVGLGWRSGDAYAAGESANVVIGADCTGIAGDFNTIRIADATAGVLEATTCFIGGISGVDVGAGQPTVKCNAVGQLGTVSSSERFKKDIATMGKTSEAIYSLRPVTFHHKNDPKNTPDCGLIAEEVANVTPDLVIYDRQGKIYSVNYDNVNVMLLNEFLKAHKKVEEQQATISELKNEVQTVVAQLKEQAAQIQKVSAQLEVGKPAPQVVANKP